MDRRTETVQRSTGSQDKGPREEARERARRWANEVAGAAEGLVESLERFDIEHRAQEAVHEAGQLVREVSPEVRRQAQSPEGQRLAEDARHGAQAASARASEVVQTVQEKTSEAAEYVEDQWHELKESAVEGAERVQEAGHVAADEAKERGHLLAESGRRARKAPGNVVRDAKEAAGAWAGGMAAGLGLVLAAGVVGLAAFVVLTIALVNGLNALIGAPAGTFLVALLYAVAAGGALAGARAARRKGRKESQQHMQEARAEIAAVSKPLRRAFAGHRIARSERPSKGRNIGRVEADDRSYDAVMRRSAAGEKEIARGEGELGQSLDEYQDWNRR